MSDAWRQRQPPQEVAQVVCQHVQLQANLIGIEAVTGKPRPADGVLAFLDPLLSGAAQVVKVNDGLGSATQVGDDDDALETLGAQLNLQLDNKNLKTVSNSV